MSTLTKPFGFLGVGIGLALVAGFLMAKGHVPPLPPAGRTPGLGLTITEYDSQGLVLVVLGLVIVVGVLLIPRLARGADDGGFLFKLLLVGFAMKMVGSLARLWMNIDVYGFKDVALYDGRGEQISNYIRNLDFGSVTYNLDLGTSFAVLYTGVVYAVIGPTLYGGFLVFGAISFLGSYFFYRAFKVAFPMGNYRLFGILIFLFPSVLYWPNGIGKDALMFFFIGLATYGGAILLTRGRFIGLLPLLIGLAGAFSIRFPVTWMIVIGLVAAFLLGRGASDDIKLKITRGLLLVVGLGVIWLALPEMLSEVGGNEFTLDSSALQNVDRHFARSDPSGGSGFKPVGVSDPLFIPAALVTSLFRPFVWETHNLQSMIQAFDAVLLLGLMVWRAPSIWRAFRGFRSSPFVIFIVVYMLLMSIALMTQPNFGTLARERGMLVAFPLMLVAFEPPPKKRPGQGVLLKDAGGQ